MIYRLKKILFFLLAIFSIIFSMYWMLYDLYHCFDFVQDILISLDLNSQFNSDVIIGYALEGMVVLNLTALICIIFYRIEFCFCPKLMLLFTGTINTFTAPGISSEIFKAMRYDKPGFVWKLLLAAYAAIALAAIVWLMIAMVKYPKPAPKPA